MEAANARAKELEEELAAATHTSRVWNGNLVSFRICMLHSQNMLKTIHIFRENCQGSMGKRGSMKKSTKRYREIDRRDPKHCFISYGMESVLPTFHFLNLLKLYF